MLTHLRPAIVLIAAFTLLTGLVLPIGFVTVGTAALPFKAGGSLITQNGHVVGSALIGQNFTDDKYFWGRPSALMGTDPKDAGKQIATPYDASESGASNLAPTSKALLDRIKGDLGKYGNRDVPADAVTSSGSGLDPDISPDNADRQVARVAKARGVSEQTVRQLVATRTDGPDWGLFGAAHINVLALNQALDAIIPR